MYLIIVPHSLKYLYILPNLVLIQRVLQLRAEAEECLKRDNFMNAIDLFTQAIELDPKNAVLYIRRAHAYGRAGYLDPESQHRHYRESIKDADKAIALQPRWRAVCINTHTHTHMYKLVLK